MSVAARLGALLMAALSGAAGAADEAAALGAPMAPEALEAQRGGESRYEFNFQETKATMENTVATGSNNGANTISGGAFGGASGFPVAVQNSGNNVIVQNAFIINLDVR
jgi:hypothetical protein